jgi:hypothetical protein
MQLRILTILLLLAATVFSAHGQSLDPETAGRHYVIAFPDTTGNTVDNRYPSPIRDTMAIWIYSDVDNSVRIQGPGYDRTVFPRAGSFEIVYLDDTSGSKRPLIVDSIGRASNSVFRIDAEHSIILYCFVVTKWGGEAWTPVPVENWGKEYYSASLESEIIKSVSPGGSTYREFIVGEGAQILIISASDNTTVHISPTDTLAGKPDTVVTLQAHQAYLVQSWLDTLRSHVNLRYTDIGGTRIVSDKPIGVISGNPRAMGNPKDPIGFAKNAFKNLLAEWLAPVDQHGREFVYLPTWDSRRVTGDSGEVLKEKRVREIVRLYGTNAGGAAVNVLDSVVQYLGALTPSQVLSDTARLSRPRVYYSGAPIQVVMSSTSVGVFRNNASPEYPISGTYDAWSPYMVDLTPREQWSNFAPYYAPEYPANMEHFINIVADTISAGQIVTEEGLPVTFDRPITGTDLVWTTLSVTPGKNHYLRGLNTNTTFFAFAYGLVQGIDSFLPNIRIKQDEPALAGSGRERVYQLRPAEYKEIVAISYGYPIAPRRTTLGNGDILQIDRVGTRCALDIHAYATNQNPLGLRSVSLDSVVNARLEPVDPALFADIRGRSDVKVRVLAVDPLQDAKATVVFTDRTGRRSTTPFVYQREGGGLDAVSALDFGSVWVGTAVDTTITLKNNSAEDLCIGGFRMAHGGAGFSIVSDGGAPRTLKPGEEMIMTVRASPTSRDSVALDTLLVKLCCGEVPIPFRTGVLSGVDSQHALENAIALIQPNPTTERAKITLRLRRSGQITVRIYRSTGELVREIYTGLLGAGEHRMIWDATGEASGGYRCQVEGAEWSGSAAIMVVR